MKFKVGQKAVIACKEPSWLGHELNGTVVTILSRGDTLPGYEYWGLRYRIEPCPSPYDGYAFESALEPVISRGDFERFMERVMKPVHLGAPRIPA